MQNPQESCTFYEVFGLIDNCYSDRIDTDRQLPVALSFLNGVVWPK